LGPWALLIRKLDEYVERTDVLGFLLRQAELFDLLVVAGEASFIELVVLGSEMLREEVVPVVMVIQNRVTRGRGVVVVGVCLSFVFFGSGRFLGVDVVPSLCRTGYENAFEIDKVL
jgi:Na+-transporting NADH:ubiquinone oxidoreductase subunit NqrD